MPEKGCGLFYESFNGINQRFQPRHPLPQFLDLPPVGFQDSLYFSQQQWPFPVCRFPFRNLIDRRGRWHQKHLAFPGEQPMHIDIFMT